MSTTIKTETETPVAGTLDDMEPGLRALGFTGVETMGGVIDLAAFDPYGMRRVGSVNIQTEKWAHHIYRGRLVYINGKPYLSDEKHPAPPFLGGLFPLV